MSISNSLNQKGYEYVAFSVSITFNITIYWLFIVIHKGAKYLRPSQSVLVRSE